MSLNTAKDYREQRANVVAQLQDLVAKVKEEDRDFSAEEEEQFERMSKQETELLSKAERLEKFEQVESLRSDVYEEQTNYKPSNSRINEQDRDLAFRGWLLSGSDHQTNEQRNAMQKTGLLHQNKLQFNLNPSQPRYLEQIRELRGTSATPQSLTAAHGGYTVPDEMMRSVETALLAYGGMRQACDVIRTGSGADLPIPTSNDTGETGKILGENTQETVESIAFGQVVLKSFKYSSKIVKVSYELLADSSINLPSYIGDQLGTRIGRITNSHFTVSASTNTANNPEGMVSFATASSTAAGTASSASVTYSELVAFLHSVDPAYRVSPNFRFMFNDNTLKVLKQMVDTQGRPLWVPGVAVREPDTILGYPYIINQDVVSQSLNARFMVVGDLSKYKIRDCNFVQLVRMNERYADYGQVGFVMFSRHDGRGVDAGTAPIKCLVSGSST